MGYLSDIISTAKSIKRDLIDDRTSKSISKGALDGTLQFPCIVSDTISVEMATAISKTLERTYAAFVQTVISMNSTVNISIDKTPADYIKRIHKNINTFESMMIDKDEIGTFMEKVKKGTYTMYVSEACNMIVFFNTADKATRMLLESHREMLETELSFIDTNPIPNIGNSIFYEADNTSPTMNDAFRMMMKQKERETYLNTVAKNNVGIKLINDRETKKLNDMQPYNMQVRLLAVNDNNEFVQFMDFIIGIKVVLHTVKSEEMVYNTKRAIENNGLFFNFLKWTTGEKSFFKDLLLNIDDVKLDVANQSSGASQWWLTLKRMKETSKLQKSLFSKHQFVPNSTLVINSIEVDYIENNFGYNLRDPKIAKKLMNSLFLMNFIYVDDGTRMINVLYDGQNAYQVYSLEAFEKEAQTNSNKLGKELVRMISR